MRREHTKERGRSGRALLLAVFFVVSRVSAHPGNGIVALSEASALTGDAVSNGVWLFEPGKPPSRRVESFHCHWVTKGLDGKLYAESLAERGGAWETSIYRLGSSGKIQGPVASSVDPASGVFLVDEHGNVVHQLQDGIVVDRPRGAPAPFRGSGKLAKGEFKLATIKAMAWGPAGALYASDGSRILRAGSDGVLKEIAKLQGDVIDRLYAGADGNPLVWGLTVDTVGTVYAAVPALGGVFRIAKDGKQDVAAHSDDGWAALGVAILGSTVFILEGKTTERNNYGPRVRRLVGGGRLDLLGVVNPEP